MRTLLQICFAALCATSVVAADVTQPVSGSIIDRATSEPLPGANIVVLGTRQGAIADANGQFTIRYVEQTVVTLRVSMIGYASVKKTIDLATEGQDEIVIQLSELALAGDEIVVTATRTERHKRDVPVIVNIVDEKIFEDTQSETLADGIVFQPGLRVETNCQNCGFTQLRINGLEGGYSQILIDGRPIFSALDGVYGLEQIPASMVEQIEVVRGGGSALYGGNAIAGTVNVITREAINTGFNVSVANAYIDGTPDRTVNVSTSLVTDDQRTGLTLFGVVRDRSPYDHDGDGFSEIVDLQNNSFGLRSTLRPGPLSKFTVEFHSLNEERRGGNRFDFRPHEADIAEWLKHRVVGGSVSFETTLSTVETNEFSIYASAQRTDRESYYGAGRDPNAYGTSLDRTLALGTQYSRSITGTNDITLGADLKYNRLTDEIQSYQRFTDQDVTTVGVYAQTDWKPVSGLNLLVGGRLDHHSLMDDPVISPRANILYNLTERGQLRLSGSTGFRAPQTFDEDLHIESVNGEALLIQLSPDLGAERSRSLSGSYDYSFSNPDYYWGFTLEGFYTNVSDAFVLEDNGQDAAGNLLLLKTNGDGAVVRGTTLDIRASTWKSSFQAGFTIQSSRYDSPVEWADGHSSDQILRTPSVYGYCAASWQFNEVVSLALSGTYTGPMDVPHFAGFITDDRMERTEPFWVANALMDLDLEISETMPELELKFGIKNIFNSYQDDFDQGIDRDAGYIYGPSQPRSLTASVKVAY